MEGKGMGRELPSPEAKGCGRISPWACLLVPAAPLGVFSSPLEKEAGRPLIANPVGTQSEAEATGRSRDLWGFVQEVTGPPLGRTQPSEHQGWASEDGEPSAEEGRTSLRVEFPAFRCSANIQSLQTAGM